MLTLDLRSWLERFRALSLRERIVTGAAAGLVALLLLDRMLLQPILQNMTGMDEQMALARKQIVQQERNLRLRPAIEQEYGELSARVRMAGSSDQLTTEMLHGIEKISGESKFKIANLKPKAVKDRGEYRVLSADLEAQGSMAELLSFLYALRHSPRLLHVELLKIRPVGEQSQTLAVTLTVSQMVLIEESGS